MREPEVITLGGHTYEIKPLNTSAMIKLMAKTVRIVGPSFAAMLDNPSQLVSSTNIGAVLAELSERLEEDDVLAVCKVLAEHTLIVSGDRKLPLGGASGAQWEIHFQGDAVALFSWLGGALKLNFGPLVAWLEAEAKALAAKATAASAAAK